MRITQNDICAMVNECVKRLLKEYKSYTSIGKAILNFYSDFIEFIDNDEVKRQMEEEDGLIYEMISNIFKPEYKIKLFAHVTYSRGSWDEAPFEDVDVEILDDEGLWNDINKIPDESIREVFKKAYDSFEENTDVINVDWSSEDEMRPPRD